MCFECVVWMASAQKTNPFVNGIFLLNRFATFRKILDAEMKDATKCGIAQKCQMDSREEITEDEEGVL